VTTPTPTLDPPIAVARSRLHAAAEFVRYFAASGLALAVDVGLFRAALWMGWQYPLAAMLGFVGGVAVAYVVSVRWVFETRAVKSATLEFGAFIAVGVAGLLLTEGLLWIAVERLGLAPLPAKLCVAVAVFLFNFGLRKAMLFSARAR
jgi:putative flippase GtrA